MLVKVIESVSDTFFVQIALILFFSVFISVLIREAIRPRREVSRMAHLPLEMEPGAPASDTQPAAAAERITP